MEELIDLQKLIFFNPSKNNLNFNQMIEEIFNYLMEQPKNEYEIVVGCDSSSEEKPTFPIALVALRKGQGGRFFLTRVRYPEGSKKRFMTFQQRILMEVYLSCEMALLVRDILKERIKRSQILLNYEFEYIHADVGPNGRTKDMIKEVVGLIKGRGFEAKIKPEAFAASTVADRFS